jgi:hypothetical protein
VDEQDAKDRINGPFRIAAVHADAVHHSSSELQSGWSKRSAGFVQRACNFSGDHLGELLAQAREHAAPQPAGPA